VISDYFCQKADRFVFTNQSDVTARTLPLFYCSTKLYIFSALMQTPPDTLDSFINQTCFLISELIPLNDASIDLQKEIKTKDQKAIRESLNSLIESATKLKELFVDQEEGER
jgi:hypothetical protein